MGSILGRTFGFYVSEHVSENVMIGFSDEGWISFPEETTQTWILFVLCSPVEENLRVVLEYFVFVEFNLLHVRKGKSVEPDSIGASPIVNSPRRKDNVLFALEQRLLSLYFKFQIVNENFAVQAGQTRIVIISEVENHFEFELVKDRFYVQIP